MADSWNTLSKKSWRTQGRFLPTSSSYKSWATEPKTCGPGVDEDDDDQLPRRKYRVDILDSDSDVTTTKNALVRSRLSTLLLPTATLPAATPALPLSSTEQHSFDREEAIQTGFKLQTVGQRHVLRLIYDSKDSLPLATRRSFAQM
jgi:hypothetical protein